MQPAFGGLSDYWIGDFNFISMEGFPETAKQQPVTEVRPGTQGHGLWLTGVRATPVQVVTHRDLLDMDDVAAAYVNYTSFIGARVPVMYAGRPFQFLYDILNVEVVSSGDNNGAKNTILGVGGTLGISNALLICRWTLIAANPFNQT